MTKVKKRTMFVLLGILLCLIPMCSNAKTNDVGIQVNIAGTQISYRTQDGTPFVDESGRTQVPFRKTMETFGCDVLWDTETKTATAVKYGITVDVPIGESFIYKNGVAIPNDTTACIVEGRTYLPIRAVLESFGANVNWHADTQTIMVTVPDAAQTTETTPIQIHFLDVGQADATLIDDGTFEILIDGGTTTVGESVVSYLSNYVDGTLDVVLATHEDADHIGGLSEVLSAYDVETIIDNGRSKDTQTYTQYQQAVQSEQAIYKQHTQIDAITLPSGAVFEILEIAGSYDTANDNSVISKLCYGDVNILFMGDATTSVTDNNITVFSDVDILKAGHHGSDTSVNATFLNTVKPEYIIISAGANNTYGHPHTQALSQYLSTGGKVYGTFRSGDIIFSTNGKQILCDTTQTLTISDAGAVISQNQASQTTTTEPQYNTIEPSTQIQPQQTVYIGNKNSKIFHKADCASVDRMSENNKVSFDSVEEALAQGYRGCYHCNP